MPDALVRAIKNDPYTSGDSDISTTQLYTPPQMVYLNKKHAHELTQDAIDRVWALLGSSVHGIIEQAGALDEQAIVEERFYFDVQTVLAKWRLGGQIDIFERGVLSDWKVTSVWAAINGGKKEWEIQANVNDFLMHKNGIEADALQVVAIFRDWSKGQATGDDYPSQQVQAFPLERWSRKQQERYILDRVLVHQKAVINSDYDECSNEDMWARDEKWAVKKIKNKKASKLFDNPHEANEYLLTMKDPAEVQHRLPSTIRCDSYCTAAPYCKQHKEHQAKMAFQNLGLKVAI